MEIKVTQKMKYEGMIAYFKGEETDLTEADFIKFCEERLADLEKKALKSKERNAKKKAEDPLLEIVFNALTYEYQTIAEVAEAVALALPEGAEEVSAQKITARLTKLVKSGDVEKEQVTVEVDGKKSKKMGYKVAVGETDEEPEDAYEDEV